MQKPNTTDVRTQIIHAPIYLPKSEFEARKLFYEGRVRESFFLYYGRAESGSNAAQSVVALMYLLGYIECEDKKFCALYWARKAADGDESFGHWVLAWALLEQSEITDGLSHLIVAGEQGFSPAIYSLASFVSNGVILPLDTLLAESLLSLASIKGHFGAKLGLTSIHRSGEFGVAKRLRAHAVTFLRYLFAPVLKSYRLIVSDKTGAKYLIYFRAVAIENEYRCNVNGEGPNHEIAVRIDNFMKQKGLARHA